MGEAMGPHGLRKSFGLKGSSDLALTGLQDKRHVNSPNQVARLRRLHKAHLQQRLRTEHGGTMVVVRRRAAPSRGSSKSHIANPRLAMIPETKDLGIFYTPLAHCGLHLIDLQLGTTPSIQH